MTSRTRIRMLLVAAALGVVAVVVLVFVSSGPRGESSAVEPVLSEPVVVAEPEVLTAAVDEEEVDVVPEPVAPPVEPTPAQREPEPQALPELVEFSPLPPNWAPAKVEYGSVLVRVFESRSREPASNVAVWLRRGPMLSNLVPERTPTALTDEHGECRFERVATGVVEVGGYPTVSAGRAQVMAGQDHVIEVGVKQSVLLRGRVVDRSGRRVAGAGIFQLYGACDPLGPIARTDGDGNYVARVRHYPFKLELCAVGEGFIPSAVQHLELGIFDTEPKLDFTLGAEGASITVQVVNGEGGPIPEADVYLQVVFVSSRAEIPAEEKEPWNHNSPVLWKVVTDAKGRAELRGLPRREFRISARAAGFAPDTKAFCLAGGGVTPPTHLKPFEQPLLEFEVVEHGDTVTLRLDKGLTVEGRVCSPARVPAAFAVVHAWMGDPPISHWVRADEDGFFRIFNVSPDFQWIAAHLDGRKAEVKPGSSRPGRPAIWNPVLE